MRRTILVLECDECGREISRGHEDGVGKDPRDTARELGLPVRYGPGYRDGRDLCMKCASGKSLRERVVEAIEEAS